MYSFAIKCVASLITREAFQNYFLPWRSSFWELRFCLPLGSHFESEALSTLINSSAFFTHPCCLLYFILHFLLLSPHISVWFSCSFFICPFCCQFALNSLYTQVWLQTFVFLSFQVEGILNQTFFLQMMYPHPILNPPSTLFSVSVTSRIVVHCSSHPAPSPFLLQVHYCKGFPQVTLFFLQALQMFNFKWIDYLGEVVKQTIIMDYIQGLSYEVYAEGGQKTSGAHFSCRPPSAPSNPPHLPPQWCSV